MPHYEIFLGAPTLAQLKEYDGATASRYRWQTAEANSPGLSSQPPPDSRQDVYHLPPATLEAAGRRISMLYANIIFNDVEGPDDDNLPGPAGTPAYGPAVDQTTIITWPPTAMDDVNDVAGMHTARRHEITFLRPTASLSRSRGRSQIQTQETQDTNSLSFSFSQDESSNASVARFPTFHFNLNSLVSLSSLQNPTRRSHFFGMHGPSTPNAKQKISLLVAVLETEGPDMIRIKKGPDAGKEVAILKVIIGDDEGRVCRLTAWREVAERWGGFLSGSTAMKRGDVVYLQNVLASKEAASTAAQSTIFLTASPALGSSMLICYRTMPRAPDPSAGVNDERFRPDLRLGYSDAVVRKVAAVVKWFQDMAGLPYS